MSLDTCVIVVWFAGPLVGLVGGALAIASARRAVNSAPEEVRARLRKSAVIMPT